MGGRERDQRDATNLVGEETVRARERVALGLNRRLKNPGIFCEVWV